MDPCLLGCWESLPLGSETGVTKRAYQNLCGYQLSNLLGHSQEWNCRVISLATLNLCVPASWASGSLAPSLSWTAWGRGSQSCRLLGVQRAPFLPKSDSSFWLSLEWMPPGLEVGSGALRDPRPEDGTAGEAPSHPGVQRLRLKELCWVQLGVWIQSWFTRMPQLSVKLFPTSVSRITEGPRCGWVSLRAQAGDLISRAAVSGAGA